MSTDPLIPGQGSKGFIVFLGVVLLALGIGLPWLVVDAWPDLAPGGGTTDAASAPADTTSAGGSRAWVSDSALLGRVEGDAALILVVILASLLGSYIHVASSFTWHVGHGKFEKVWTWWYLLRFAVGVSLSVIFYWLVRGGLLAVDAGSGDVSPFGVAAVAGLVGLSSKQATKKLKDLFDQIFKAEEGGEAGAAPAAPNPQPAVDSVDPARAVVGSADVPVTIAGSNFLESSVVQINGEEIAAEFKDASTMGATIPAARLSEKGKLQITVRNPEPGGGVSRAVEFLVEGSVED